MKLVDLKRNMSNMESCCGISKPNSKNKMSYPYGTSLNLDKDSLKKLGIAIDSYKIGDTVEVLGKGKITSISSSANENNANQDLSIQITSLGVSPSKSGKTLKEAIKK